MIVVVNVLFYFAVLFVPVGIYVLLMNAEDRKALKKGGRNMLFRKTSHSSFEKAFSISKEAEKEEEERNKKLEREKQKAQKKLKKLGFDGRNLDELPDSKKKKVLEILGNGPIILHLDQLEKSKKKEP